MEKKIIISVHAAPKTHPGGVHGALFKDWYHSFSAGDPPIKKEPRAKAPKLRIMKTIVLVSTVVGIEDCLKIRQFF